ncbi:hypothetical protein NMG60_11020082 [Bertholletia excelsa]
MPERQSLPSSGVQWIPPHITTEEVQKYLDENTRLILAIMEYQNLGKSDECAQLQAQLQKNLVFLAALADAQPPTYPSQTPQQSTGQQEPQMQQPQPAKNQQQSLYSPQLATPQQQTLCPTQRMAFQFSASQLMQGQMGAAALGTAGTLVDVQGGGSGGKHDNLATSSGGSQGNSASRRGWRDSIF